jgi:transcriptional regulator GlxA family with amidase domain
MKRILPLLLLGLGACATTPSTAPGSEGDPRLAVGFLMIDGVYNTELMGPLDVFHHTVFHTEPGMRVFTIGRTHAPVTSFEGLRLIPDYSFVDAPPIDVLVVASAEHNLDTDLDDEELIEWVKEAGERADWLVSLCDGAFVLAEAGLLDGLHSTTFPADVDAYAQRYPHLSVLRDLSFVHDGNAITSQGGVKSYDAALYLVEHLYGPEVARGVARGICVDWDLARIAHARPSQ